jgi:hypothetical protein
MMSGLSCATLMRALLRLSLHVEILIIDSTRLIAYSNNERAKQMLYDLDDSVWGMKITALEESADFATLDTEKLFSKLKSQ